MPSHTDAAPESDIPLIDQWLVHLREIDRAESTIDTYRKIIARADDQLPRGVARATSDELRTWLYEQPIGAATRAQYDAALRSFYRWACDPYAPRLDWDPTTLLHRPRVHRRLPRPVTDGELATLLARCTGRYRLWALLAAYAGARCCEIAELHRDHITEAGIRLLGKGRRERVVPTHPDVWAAVADLPAGPLAVDKRGRMLGRLEVSDAAAAHFRHLGLTGITLHRLRHWYGTTVQQLYHDLRVTQELLGHASPATTAVYTKVADRDRTAAVAMLPSVSALGAGGEIAAA